MNSLPFENFKAACASAHVTRILPEGIRFRGRLFWDRKLRFRVGQKVRIFIDPTGPFGLSLVVLSKRTGRFLTNAPESTQEGFPVIPLDLMKEYSDYLR